MGQKTLTDNPKHICIHLQHVYNREQKWVQFELELERIVADYKSYGTILEFLRAVGSRILS